MRRRGRVPSVAAGIGVLLMIAAHSASLEDGKAVFARREDTMKHMGRPLFLGIGRVVKGTAAYGRCRLKTGTLTGVSNLSGYCFNTDGKVMVFSTLMGSVANTETAHYYQDKIAGMVAGY